MTMQQLSAFFGWMTVFNLALLSVAWLFLWLKRPFVISVTRYFVPVDAQEIEKTYFRWLALYEMLIYLFNLMPWLALQMIG